MTQSNSVTEFSRVLLTSGIHNFRDYGRYPVTGGGHLVQGRLYRSGEHTNATDEDLALLAELGLTAVVDLRGVSERTKAPCRRPAGFDGHLIYSDGETAEFAPHAEAAAQAIEGADARRTLQGRYKTLPFRPVLVDVFRQYFRALAEVDGPTVVYCSAGKDRTGLLVALLHLLLGVHRDDIFEDYLLTNTAGDAEARVASVRGELEKRFGKGLSDEAVRVITSVEASFLQSALDAIVEQHGSIEAYLADVLQVTPQLRAALESRLII